MKISIIIPVYKVEPYIDRCLKSVFSQSWKGEMECILVDDCGGDRSMEMAREAVAAYNGPIRFMFLKHEVNKGLSGARNTGVLHATGDYLYFLDSDDEITPDCMEQLSAVAERYPGVDIVQGNLVVTQEMWRYLDTTNYQFPAFTTDREWIEEHVLTDVPETAWNKLYRRQWFIDKGLWFREGIVHEDHQWRLAHAAQVTSIAFCNAPTYIYYLNKNSITSARVKDASAFSRLTILEEYIPRISRKHRYTDVIRQLYKVWLERDQINDISTFNRRYRKIVNDAIHSKRVPLSARIGFYYLLHGGPTLKFVTSVFWRPAYRIIRTLKGVRPANVSNDA